jgi:hypothetical protein
MQKTTFNQLSSFNIENRFTWLLIRETKTYSSSLMRFLYFSQVWWDLVSTELTSRSHQAWWVAFVKLDESLSSDLMTRSQFDKMRLFESFLSSSQMMNRSQLDEMWSFESSHQKHIRRLKSQEQAYVTRWVKTRQSKHWRWNNQARSRKRIFTNNFCMRKFVSYLSDHISHDRERIVAENFCTRRFVLYFSNHISHRDKTQNTLSTYSRSKSSHQYSSQ